MMNPEIRPGQIWRHFKGGVYRVLYLAKHSETGEELVIYTKNGGDGTVWARLASMWMETVERDGKSQPRFELICDSPRENFCADCHWYETEEQYCFRQGNHSYNESSCELWEPKGEKRMKDITYCTSTACPSKECRIKIANNSFQPGEIISMADFSGTCRFYIGWMVDKVQREEELGKAKGKNVHATYYDVLYEEGGAGTT